MRPQLRSTHSKTALVLAGGGLSGAMYEIGALRAIDDMLTDRTVNDFDIYVGTSAGAIVGALLANGATPATMLQGLAGDLPGVRPIQRRDLFQLNVQDVLKLGIKPAAYGAGRVDALSALHQRRHLVRSIVVHLGGAANRHVRQSGDGSLYA